MTFICFAFTSSYVQPWFQTSLFRFHQRRNIDLWNIFRIDANSNYNTQELVFFCVWIQNDSSRYCFRINKFLLHCLFREITGDLYFCWMAEDSSNNQMRSSQVICKFIWTLIQSSCFRIVLSRVLCISGKQRLEFTRMSENWPENL